MDVLFRRTHCLAIAAPTFSRKPVTSAPSNKFFQPAGFAQDRASAKRPCLMTCRRTNAADSRCGKRQFVDGTARPRSIAIVGAEAIANIKGGSRAGAKPDWTRKPALSRWLNRGAFRSGRLQWFICRRSSHRIAGPLFNYAFDGSARRAALGEMAKRSRSAWLPSGKSFARVRGGQVTYAGGGRPLARALKLSRPARTNPIITSPYTKTMVARTKSIRAAARAHVDLWGTRGAWGIKDRDLPCTVH